MMLVIIGTITGAESLITLVGILSIPGALFSGKEVIMFSTSEQLILQPLAPQEERAWERGC
jgi:hypothetical protein